MIMLIRTLTLRHSLLSGRLPPAFRSGRHAPATRSYASKEPSVTSQFYKTFTRPIAKTILIAVFTYQVLYWSWVKLEQDEVRDKTDAEISALEAEVDAYKRSKAGLDVVKRTK